MGVFGEINSVISLLEKGVKLIKNFHISVLSKSRGLAYYFEEYHKDVVIDKDGNGLVNVSFVMNVIDPEKVESFVRTIRISDAKAESIFPTLKVMLKVPKENVFREFGFWYLADQNILTSVTEDYEYNIATTNEGIAMKEDKKALRIKFEIDTSKLRKRQQYRVTYICSIPGMFPIKNGVFDKGKERGVVAHKKYGKFCSSIAIKHLIKEFFFTLSFDSAIKVSIDPTAKSIDKQCNKEKNEKVIGCKYEDTILHQKYTVNLKNPKYSNTVKIEWDIQN